MKALFNSLGSNYSQQYIDIVKHIVWKSDLDDLPEVLPAQLCTYFQNGSFIFYYKGRDAIASALKIIEKPVNKNVFIQAFACYAIEEAVARADCTPQYVDVEKNSLNMSVDTLERAAGAYGYPGFLLVQHTLGHAADIARIRKWCDKHHVFLIEDVAQAFGAKDIQANHLGMYADAVIGSFGRDKIIDAVSGGFLFIPNKHVVSEKIIEEITPKKHIEQTQLFKDMFYPLITHFFREKYPSIFSKLLLESAKKFHIITTPLAAPVDERCLPDKLAVLAGAQLETVANQLEHRKKIALDYFNELEKLQNVEIPVTLEQVRHGSNLRFPLLVKNPEKIIKACKDHNIFISDRWYRSPVDCSSLDCKTVYKNNSCPNAEYAAEHILNLPTHMYVNNEQVEKIIKIIKKIS